MKRQPTPAHSLRLESLERRDLFTIASEPVLLKDINPSFQSSFPTNIVAFGDEVFFTAGNASFGKEIWKTDGTQLGTVLLKDIWPGPAASTPRDLMAANGTLYFAADDGVRGKELWKSDGTETGTVLVKDIRPGQQSSWRGYSGHSIEYNGLLFFAASDGSTGFELWRTDGTATGTMLVKDVDPGGRASYPSSFVQSGGGLFFDAQSEFVSHLWRTDGTTSGTIRMSGSTRLYSNMISHNGQLFFSGKDEIHGAELWASDGTPEGTRLLKEIQPGIAGGSPVFSKSPSKSLYFSAAGPLVGRELWRTDGTETGTVLFKDIVPGIESSDPWGFTEVEDFVYFAATEPGYGNQLWRTNGTADGTVRITNLGPGSGGFVLGPLLNINGTLFFSANDGVHGNELWKSDGTAAGTSMVKDIRPGAGHPNITQLTNVNGSLYFVADDGSHGEELWVLHPPTGDIDKNHFINGRDIDRLLASISAGTNDPDHDLTGDQVVNAADIDYLLSTILGTKSGDANLDGHVDRTDFSIVAANYGRTDSPGWTDGDFDGDERVGLKDLAILTAHYDASSIPSSAPQAAIAIAARRPVAVSLRTTERTIVAHDRLGIEAAPTTTRTLTATRRTRQTPSIATRISSDQIE